MLLLANYEDYLNRISAGAVKRMAVGDLQASMSAGMETDSRFQVSGTDAIIEVSGPMSYKYDFYCWLYDGTSYQGLKQQIHAAQANADVRRIVLVMDTPGGDVTGCKETAAVIAGSKKPIDAMVDPTCASAGLWLASQCRKIVCIESGDVGSLGVQIVAKSYARMFQEAGIDISVIRAAISPEKNLGHPYEAFTDEAKAHFQSRCDKWGELFLADVAKGRGVSREVALEQFGKGQMLDADQALACGLIDSIGTIDSVLSEQIADKPSATKYNPHR